MSTTFKASQEALEKLHGAIARELTNRIANGEATAADISAAIKFLKDNHIDAVPKEGSPLADLAAALPFPTADGVRDEDSHP